MFGTVKIILFVFINNDLMKIDQIRCEYEYYVPTFY